MGPLELREYTGLDAVGLSELIRAGEVTATEVEAVARVAIAQADADLGALTMRTATTAPVRCGCLPRAAGSSA
ncbi:hypothetical protein ACVH9Z_13445 [Rhodococcus opacus]|uniref:Amidase n=1 Tax=Rhodococcus opacus TaxID=37919 RepID=A0AAX3YEJ6_RHOOP|nr:hypothetical protein [Rhodococcus opacus]MCZ4586834.1 hypothetical protein [Rhodococcus opacus]WKN55662.1 hypothetical protein HJ581_0018665 [Rhodococcus opacus]WLF46695.1 hypothetical protein Q5707_33230 [Rhodococcus opacus]